MVLSVSFCQAKVIIPLILWGGFLSTACICPLISEHFFYSTSSAFSGISPIQDCLLSLQLALQSSWNQIYLWFNGRAANVAVEWLAASRAEPDCWECAEVLWQRSFFLQDHPQALHSLLLFTFWRNCIVKAFCSCVCLPQCSELSLALFACLSVLWSGPQRLDFHTAGCVSLLGSVPGTAAHLQTLYPCLYWLRNKDRQRSCEGFLGQLLSLGAASLMSSPFVSLLFFF